jgi:hypothetical protein
MPHIRTVRPSHKPDPLVAPASSFEEWFGTGPSAIVDTPTTGPANGRSQVKHW